MLLISQCVGQVHAGSFLKAVSTILLFKTYLLKPQDVISLQREVCREVLRNPYNLYYLHLLTTLLGVSHEAVPSPVEVQLVMKKLMEILKFPFTLNVPFSVGSERILYCML